MTIDWLSPGWLWLLVLVPALWLTSRLPIPGWTSRQRPAHAVLRSLLVAAIVTALAEPIVTWTATRIAVVYAVDVSASVSARALDSVARAIEAITTAVAPGDVRILAFGRREAPVASTAALRQMDTGAAADEIARLTEPDGTNLEQALASARAEIPAGTSGRIVLFSDGRETEGEARRAADRLAADGVPVFVQPMPPRDLGDTWIEAVRVNGPVVAGSPATVDVLVGSQVDADATVVLGDGARVLGERRATVTRGETTVSFDVSFEAPGARVIEARVRPDRDVLPDNDVLAREVTVDPHPRVLYVQGDPADGAVAPSALVQAGARVTKAAPKSLPGTPDAFDRWDVVVLANVARAQMPAPAMAAIAHWVEERGGGLLFAGGGRVVGESVDRSVSGYRRTEVERVLPVTFDRDDEPEVALVIVLDRSWSMNGLAMDLSKTAAEAAANTLAPTQMLGIVTFNNLPTWDVPLSRVRDSRATLHETIGRIMASGATAIFPALEQAYEALSRVRARAKHVILLSDGQTEPMDYEGLVERMSAARITVSSVALGAEADVTLLRNIASWGGGRNYVVADAKQIPEIFVKEAKNAETPGAEEGAEIKLVVRQPEFFANAATGIPTLTGRNTVTRKTDAIELIGTNRGDPLLVTWPAGLGHTAMLATDLEGRWSRGWLEWRGFGGFLSTVVRSLVSRKAPAVALTVAAGERQGTVQEVRIALEARGRDGRPEVLADPRVTLRGSGAPLQARLTEVGAGRYETRLMADTSDPITVALATTAVQPVPSRVLVTDRAAEYRFGPANLPLLQAIAATTGGALDPTPDAIRQNAAAGVARYPLAPWLFALALLLWPVDVVLRRLIR